MIRPTTPSRSAIRRIVLVAQHVLLLAEAIAGMRRDHRRRRHSGRLVEVIQHVAHRPVAHVGEVDQDALPHHRLDRRAAEVREPLVGLREQPPIEPVGKEGDRRRVGRDVSPHEVGERHVGNPAAREPAHGIGHLGLGGAEVIAALHAVDEGDLALALGPIEVVRVVRDERLGVVVVADVALDEVGLSQDRLGVLGAGRRRVLLAERELVEERIQHRQGDLDVAGAQRPHRHPGAGPEGPVVPEPARQPHQQGAHAVAQPRVLAKHEAP